MSQMKKYLKFKNVSNEKISQIQKMSKIQKFC